MLIRISNCMNSHTRKSHPSVHKRKYFVNCDQETNDNDFESKNRHQIVGCLLHHKMFTTFFRDYRFYNHKLWYKIESTINGLRFYILSTLITSTRLLQSSKSIVTGNFVRVQLCVIVCLHLHTSCARCDFQIHDNILLSNLNNKTKSRVFTLYERPSNTIPT